MKHFYGKKAKTREISNSLSKNIDEAELTPRLTEKGNTSLYSAGTSALGVISEKTQRTPASVPSYLKPTQSFASRLRQ